MAKKIHLPDIPKVRESAKEACNILKVLANEDRMLILCQLSQGESNVGELEEQLDIHQPTLSQQLTVLRKENLVISTRQGKYIYYSLASEEVKKIMHTLFSIYCKDD